MATLSRDTSAAAERVQIQLLRQATPARRFALARSLSRTTIELSRRAIREANPDWSEAQVLHRWVELHYGASLAARLRPYLDEQFS